MGAYHPENDGHIRRRDATDESARHHHHRCPLVLLSLRCLALYSLWQQDRTTACLDVLGDTHGCAKGVRMVNKTRCVPAPVPRTPIFAQVSARKALSATTRFYARTAKVSARMSKSCGTYLIPSLVLRLSVDSCALLRLGHIHLLQVPSECPEMRETYCGTCLMSPSPVLLAFSITPQSPW